MIRVPDLGSGRPGLRLAAPGWEENLFRSRLLPEPDGSGRFLPTPLGPGLEREPAERPDFSAHPASGGGGRRLWAGDTSPSRKFQDDVAHIPRGCRRHHSRSWLAAGRPGVGRGDPDDPGRGRGRLLAPWTRQGKPEPFWKGPGQRGRGQEASKQTSRNASKRPSHPSFAKAFLRFRQGRGSRGPMLRGCGLPGCGRDWGSLCTSPFQSSTPPLEPSLGTQQETRFDPSMSVPPADARLSLCTTTRLQGPQRPLNTGAGTALDSCTKPVYPSIYMLHRMYICWEHARFSCVSPPCVVRPAAEPQPGPCQVGGLPRCPFPMQPPPTWASPCQSVRLSVRVLTSALSTLQ